MRAPIPRPPALRAVLLLLAASVAGAACKASPRTQAPQRMLVDDIEAIEAELARNRSELESAGIVVARAETTTPETPTLHAAEAAPPRDSKGEAGAEDEADADDDDVGGAEPLAEPSPPAPEPEEGEAVSNRSTDFRQGITREEKRTESSRCERICDLADATCELAQSVCDLASRHRGEPRYETACTRAEDQCRAASIACTRCE